MLFSKFILEIIGSNFTFLKITAPCAKTFLEKINTIISFILSKV